MTIAQPFMAGYSVCREQGPVGTTEKRINIGFNRPYRTHLYTIPPYPPMNRWAIVRCSSGTFMAFSSAQLSPNIERELVPHHIETYTHPFSHNLPDTFDRNQFLAARSQYGLQITELFDNMFDG